MSIPVSPQATIEYSDPVRLAAAPVVSVLMLAYNHGNYLARAIESVILQETGFPVELLIGEDCSTDGSGQIARDWQVRFPELIRVVTSERNVGAFRNYMRLLDAARGEFIAQIDGDDYWLPGKLAQQVAMLREYPGAVAVCANAITVDRAGETIGRFNDVGDAAFGLGDLLRRGNFLNNSSMVFRARFAPLLRDIGHEFIDFQTHLTLAQQGDILHIGQPLAAYRVKAAGSMVAGANPKVRELYWQGLTSVPRNLVSDRDLSLGIADFLRRVAFRSVSTRNPGLFRDWWPRAVAAAPCGAPRLALLTAASFLRVSWSYASASIRKGPRVLYRR